MGCRLRQVVAAERDEGQRIERARTRPEKSVIEAHGPAPDQRIGEAVQATRPVFFTETRHQQKPQANRDQKQRQHLTQKVRLQALDQHRPQHGPQQRHGDIQPLLTQINCAASHKVEAGGERPANRLQFIGRQRLSR